MSHDNGRTGGRLSLLTRRAKIRTLVTLTVFCLALTLSAIFSSSMICYAVSVDGTDLGQVSSRTELMDAIEAAETAASDLLGTECSIAPSVTVTADLGSASGDARTLTDMLLSTVDGIVEGYAITVNGTPVGTLDSQNELNAILSNILDAYSDEYTISASFAQEVAVEYTFISEDLENDPEAIALALSPENGDSPYSLTVLTCDAVETMETIPCSTEYQYDDTRYSDEQELIQAGQDGVLSSMTLVRRENGQEVSSQLARASTITPAVPQIILQGTIPGSRTDSTGSYIWPTEGVLTSDYGYRSVAIGSSNHKGLDIANSIGTPVYAADGGTVIFARYWDGSGYGNLIQIQHDNGDITYYGHLSSIEVSEGDKVAQGDLIGLMGVTGNVSGSHLHFEIRPEGGEPANPLDYLPEQ